MKDSHIQWCDNTQNFWIGCTKVDDLCTHCYAETRDIRFSGGAHWGKGAPRQRTSVHNWNEPRRWNRKAELPLYRGEPRPRVFCASLSDWLDDEVPAEWLADMLIVVHDCTNLDWLLLTKRPQNWLQRLYHAMEWIQQKRPEIITWANAWIGGTPPANIWMGTSVGNQKSARIRIPQLMAIPARIRFLSCEPLLGPVDLSIDGLWKATCEKSARDFIAHADDGKSHPEICRDQADRWMDARVNAKNVDWVICGGESGPGCRPMAMEWAQSLRRQCAMAGIPFFMKQLGGVTNKRGELSEFPEDLRIREFPA